MPDGRTTVRFLGATRTVTGSRFLIAIGGARLVVDCGMYQGSRELRRRKSLPSRRHRSLVARAQDIRPPMFGSFGSCQAGRA
jgi:hypothetical protein